MRCIVRVLLLLLSYSHTPTYYNTTCLMHACVGIYLYRITTQTHVIYTYIHDIELSRVTLNTRFKCISTCIVYGIIYTRE